MKKRITALFLALLLTFTCASALAEKVHTKTPGSSVYLRQGPGKGYAANGMVRDGETIIVLKKGSTWSRIQVYLTGKTGYIMNTYIKGTPAPKSEYTYGRVVTQYAGSAVNLRKSPSTKAGVVHKYYRGAVCKITGTTGDWYYVTMADGRKGYINRQYIAQGITAVTTGDVYLREGPDKGYAAKTVLSKGTYVTALSKEGEWVRVRMGTYIGYVYGSFLMKI